MFKILSANALEIKLLLICTVAQRSMLLLLFFWLF